MKVKLPPKRVHETPRLVISDAYTQGSPLFQSAKAQERSVYYMTYRRKPSQINQTIYTPGDDRIAWAGLQRINEDLLRKPVTHKEIDEALRFMANAKVSTKGLSRYYLPEAMWRKVVDEYNGRPPITIYSMPEGSVVYPNEPVAIFENVPDGMGELAAWYESKWLQCWAPSERATQDQNMVRWFRQKIKEVNPELTDRDIKFLASLQITDMGDRAGMNNRESEDLGMTHLYTWAGTDTFCGAYQAWMNSGKQNVFSSVYAMAHRNAQAYENEGDSYEALYNAMEDGDFGSMVGDVYDFEHAVNEYQVKLALRSVKEGNGKIVVSRPDSDDPLDMIRIVLNAALANGLYEEKVHADGTTWKYATFLHYISADGMDFTVIKKIVNWMIENKFVFYSWGLFGMGGNFRNGLKRDNLSAKFALSSMGNDDQGVCKFSEAIGKTTLPGRFKIVRDAEALASKTTIRKPSEPGKNAMVEYYNGARQEKPFGPGQYEDFLTIQERLNREMVTMPLSLESAENHNYPASQLILDERRALLHKYAPNKDQSNY